MTRTILTTLVVAIAIGTAAVLAHFKVAKTLPADGAVLTAPPTVVQVWFSEKPALAASALTLEGAGGAVALGRTELADERSLRAAVEGPIAPGAYKVNWLAAGSDGHVLRGSYGFTLK